MKKQREWTDNGYNTLQLNSKELSGLIGNWREGGHMQRVPISLIAAEDPETLSKIAFDIQYWDEYWSKISKDELIKQIVQTSKEFVAA